MPTDTAQLAQDATEAYLATWNATDDHERRRLLDLHWSPGVRYVDPVADVSGRDDLSALIAGVQEQFAGFVFSLVGDVDAHHDQFRFQWGLGPADGEPVVIGFDVVVLDQDSLIGDVRGFLDVVPHDGNVVPERRRSRHAGRQHRPRSHPGSSPTERSETMTAYAIAHLQQAPPHPDVAEYMERIPGTFTPFGGRFLVHATAHEVKEGTWFGNVVMIGFPDIGQARAWWDSPAYQEIAPLRSRHIPGDVILVEGVPENYDPSSAARAIREAVTAR